ncbi:MAG: EamA family transporter [Candidatus Limnocylindrales bacterium]|nr:EamA family transporter [Chloroflexota bacterium]
MSAILFGFLAALANTGQAVISKELTDRAPARQLIGVLYVGNALVLLPFAPFVDWTWSPAIVGLQLLSVALMVVTAICVWDLLDHGAASATTTATAMSPIPVVLAAAVVLPGSLQPSQILAAVIVVAGVLLALVDAFGALGRWGSVWRIVGAAAGTGLLTVISRLLGDLDVGLVETYVVRTALAAVVCLALFPPRDVMRRDIPRLLGRSVVVTLYFVFVILGAQAGSPVVVQTLVATTPLFVLGVESVRRRSAPPVRAVVAAGIVLVGVALILLA